MKWCSLILWRFSCLAVQLRRAGLIEFHRILKPARSNSVQQFQGAATIDLRRILTQIEGQLDMALCSQIVNFVRSYFVNDNKQPAAVGHIAIVQLHFVLAMCHRISIKVLNALCIEGAGPPHDAVHLVALGNQKLGQIRSILGYRGVSELVRAEVHSSFLRCTV